MILWSMKDDDLYIRIISYIIEKVNKIGFLWFDIKNYIIK